MTQQLGSRKPQKAEEKKWPLDLVRQGFRPIAAERIEQVIRSGISPQQAVAMLANVRAGAPGRPCACG
jgi:hypothetical protein